MTELAIALFAMLLALAMVMLIPTVRFALKLWRSQPQTDLTQTDCTQIDSNNPLPNAAILLCVRGADPFLSDCVQALLQQNYPRYQLTIIIDSPQDPAWEIIHQAIQQSPSSQHMPHVQVSPLVTRYDTCSLKCSALIQAIASLEETWQVVVMTDADVIPPSNWLYQLVLPLQDEQIGATTGQRWYLPSDGSWGSLFRYLWNVPAVVNMDLHQLPWAGSLAMTRTTLSRLKLTDIWRNSLSVDAPIHPAMQSLGLSIKFIPSLIVLNRETCSLRSCIRFATRQLLVARLYQNGLTIALPIFLTALPFVFAVGLLVAAILFQQYTAATWLVAGLVIYLATLIGLLILMESSVRKVLRSQGEFVAFPSLTTLIKGVIAIPLSQLGYALIMLSALLKQTVEWRGIVYQIEGPWDIRLTQYEPYQPLQATTNNNLSL